MFPAAREGDFATHDTLVPSGIILPPIPPCPPAKFKPVLIEGMPAAHVGCVVPCTGATSMMPFHMPLVPPAMPPTPIMVGSPSVMIHGQPAARWLTSGDMTACGALLGNAMLLATRTVLIGSAASGGGGGGAAAKPAAPGGAQGGATPPHTPTAKPPKGSHAEPHQAPAPKPKAAAPVNVAPGGAAAAPVVTGLGAKIDALVNMSPSLADDLRTLQAGGWSIQSRDNGGACTTDADNKVIVIDKRVTASETTAVQDLSHEVGHATNPYPKLPMDELGRKDYVELSTQQALDSEGRATFSNARTRDEILENGGPDIGIGGQQKVGYQNLYRDYQDGKWNKPSTEDAMGFQFGSGEKTSVSGETYRDYYLRSFNEAWQKEH